MAQATNPQRMTEDGRRFGVDMNFARIEDAIRSLKKDAPLNEAEQAYAVELAHLLADLAGLGPRIGEVD